ncbi:MAG: hypothetical protein J1E81_06150 [Eubacterium sp.]|nr:hypothetical protein [Eubacterium sp.]
MSNTIISQKHLEIIRADVAKWPKWKRDFCNISNDLTETKTEKQTESVTE